MSQLRLVHTADVHLGYSSEVFGAAAAEHRRRLQAAFGRCVDLCLEREAQLFVVAGDLFDSPQPSESAGTFARAQLSRLSGARPAIPCVVVPGTHDPIQPGSIYQRWLTEGLPEHVHLLTSDQPRVHLADCETTILGPSSHPGRPLQGLEADPQATFNIAVVHGSVQILGMVDEDKALITEQDIAASGMDYIALGHWHKFGKHDHGGVPALYPGSPEIVALDQATRGQALVVDLDTEGNIHWTPVATGTLQYEQRKINLADFASNTAILQALLQEAEPNKIVDVHLAGLAPPGMVIDAEQLADELAGSFFRVQVTDESHVTVEALEESQYPPQLVTGRFVRLMKQRIKEARERGDEATLRVAEHALQIGLALLEGREVLG